LFSLNIGSREIEMIEVKYINHMGDDLTVVNAARVSFNKNSELECTDIQRGNYEMKEGDKNLIRYLAEHKHISPFGHCFASFHVKAPVFVARQLVKHKFLRWNEISRRYVDDEPEFYWPEKWRGRSKNKKQGSEGVVDVNGIAPFGKVKWETLECYNKLLEAGVCPEQARMILPQSMMTEWYWSGSLDAFVDMCNLRCKPDTQAETSSVAYAIDTYMLGLYPISWAALRT
jgi:thymidylate synthase (FAD)